MAKLTKKGALAVIADQDRLANLYQHDWKTLGIPKRIAMDFAMRCDMLSDELEKQTGIERQALTEGPKPKTDYPQTGQTFDAEEIGKETAGPEEQEPDEPYMRGEFSQQRFRELRERQEDGDLGATPNPEVQNPTPGRQATFEALGRQEAASRLANVSTRLHRAASKMAQGQFKGLARPLSRFASHLMDLQVGVLDGSAQDAVANTMLKAAVEILPHVEQPKSDDRKKVARMLEIASNLSITSADDEDEEDESEEDEAKEGGKKKASHGYDLTAQ